MTPEPMNPWKYSTAGLAIVVVILLVLLLSGKMSTCSTTVTLNATCNGSAVTVNSTANTTGPNPLGSIVKAAGDYGSNGGIGAVSEPLVNPPKIVPAPEFPKGAVPCFGVAIIGAIYMIRTRYL